MLVGPEAPLPEVVRRRVRGVAITLVIAALMLVVSGCGGTQKNPAPPPPPAITVSTLVPSFVVAGGTNFSLFVNGSGFTSSSVVLWSGNAVPTTFGTSAILTASISSALIAAPGTVTITVNDSSPGATSNAVPFGIASPAAATAGVIQLITVAPDGSAADGDSLVAPAISADGRFVAFQSAATNLVSGPASGFQDIYLRDTCLGSAPPGCTPGTARISVTSTGLPTNGHSRNSAISAAGRFVVFDSSATNILPGTTVCGGTACVFLRDTCSGAAAGCSPGTILISVAMDGTTANGGSPSISADGRFVAFDSSSTNVVPGDSNGAEDVFVRDTCFGASGACTPHTSLVSVSSTGAQGNTDSHTSAASATGRFVVFQSFASNLVANDTNAQPDVFVRDTCAEAASPCIPSTTRVDVATDGTQSNNSIFPTTPSITADGRLTAFASNATNLVSSNVVSGNVYARDTCAGAPAGCTPATTLISLANDGSLGNCASPSQGQSISANGRFVAFDSIATNLVPGDTFPACGFEDIFVRDTCFAASPGCLPSTVRVSVANNPNPQTQANAFSGFPAITADGHYLVFLSAATNLLPEATNGHRMVFLAKTGF